MWINLKRFMLEAILLASLSLLIQGCGSSDGPSTIFNPQSSKPIAGTVSDLTTNLPLPGATIAAYSIVNGVPASAQALGGPVTSASDGSYALHIPSSYQGSVLVKATVPPAKLIDRLAKLLSLSYTSSTIRAVIPAAMVARNPIQPVMLNFASEALVVFIETNIVNAATPPSGFTKTGFSSDNIQKAIIVLESLFGPHFTQFSLPKTTFDTNTTIAQQDLLVSITALDTVLANTPALTLADILTRLTSPGGLGTLADDIKRAVFTAATVLIQAGTIPPEYVPNLTILAALSNAQTTPVPVPSLSDTTPPTAPSGLTAVPVNPRAVRLAWNASTDNSGNVAGYVLYRTDPAGVNSLVDYVRNSLTYTDFTASPATAYTYVVVAYDATRNYSDASNAATAITPPSANPAGSTPPTQPVGLVVKGFTDTQVNLQWVQSTKRNSDGTVVPASGYYVYRNSQIVATVQESSYIDTNLLPATEYTYYIKAFDENATVSTASTPLSIRTLTSSGSIVVVAPANLALAEAALFNKVVLQWDASTTPNVTYNVYRGAELIAAGITSNRYSDSTVIPQSSYSYTVAAQNSNGESDHSGPLTVDVPASPATNQTAPSVPQNFALVTPATSNSVALIWAPSTKTDGDQIVAGYDVLRGDASGTIFTLIATVRTPGYTDTTATPSSTFTYQVRSFSSTGTRSAPSSTLTVATAAIVDVTDTTPPTAPTNLRLTSPATSSAVILTWNPSTKNTGDLVVAGYRVYRDGSQIGDVPGVGFVDTTVSANATYTYTVKAYDNPGNLSASSNVLTVTTPAPTAGIFILSGRITFNGIGVPGVALTIIGSGSGSTFTNENGDYFFNVINGSYSISPTPTPADPPHSIQFSPPARSVLVNGANVTGLDFVAATSVSVTGSLVFPTGSITGGLTYPTGTITGGITYPAGTVIGGVTYPTATVIGGVTYPTGTVIGGITYPNGVVIGGVSYPPGTVVGGIAFPPGTVIGGVTFPPGTVIGGVTFPPGTVIGGVSYPAGTVTGGINFPAGTVTGGINFPAGTVTGGINFSGGTVIGSVINPDASITLTIIYPP